MPGMENLVPKSVPQLGFRGDTRPPELIFQFGFSRREASWDHYQIRWNTYLEERLVEKLKGAGAPQSADSEDSGPDSSDAVLEDGARKLFGFLPESFEFPNFQYSSVIKTNHRITGIKNEQSKTIGIDIPVTPNALYKQWLGEAKPRLRPQDDVAPSSAVCITDDITIAALFPLGTAQKPPAAECWIYAVQIDNAYMTFDWQKSKGSVLAAAREMALVDIPSGHVMAAVHCTRSWTGEYNWKTNPISFTLAAAFSMNKKLDNQANFSLLSSRVGAVISPLLGKKTPCKRIF